MLQYTLCVGRFAHAIKRLGHHKVGQSLNADKLKAVLNEFLSEFVLTNKGPYEKTAEKPLAGYEVEVFPMLGKQGNFESHIMLQLHHELDSVRVELRTQLVSMEPT